MRIRRYIPFFILTLLVGVGVLVFSSAVSAQVSLDFPTQFGGFSTQELKETIENIVRIVLGFVGIIFLVILIAAGIIWTTSGGNQEKITRAKKMIAAAVIGLLVTLSAYSIAYFIISNLQIATTSGPLGGGSSTCGYDGDSNSSLIDPGEICDDGFLLNGTVPGGCNAFCTGLVPFSNGCFAPPPGPDGVYGDPDGPGPLQRDDAVKVCTVTNPANLNQAITIEGFNFGTPGPQSDVSINGTSAQVVTCGGVPAWNDSVIRVTVDGSTSLVDTLNNVVVTRDNGTTTTVCSGTDCGSTDVQDGSTPFIECMVPTSGPHNGYSGAQITGGNFGPSTNGVFMEGASGRFNITSANIQTWSDDTIDLDVPGAGVDGIIGNADDNLPEAAITGPVRVRDAGPNAFLGDSDDILSNYITYTVTCTNATSTSNQCASGCCSSALQCAPTANCSTGSTGGSGGLGAPTITAITPDNGREGNLVTIQGYNFGTTSTHELRLVWDPTGVNTDMRVPQPSIPACTTTWWSASQIIMEVPDVPPSGPDNPLSPPFAEVYVLDRGTDNTTFTPDDVESNRWTFELTDVPRPGICSVSPASGIFGSFFTVDGNNYGGTSQDIFFGPPGPTPASANNQTFLSSTQATGYVPNILPTNTTVAVDVDGEISNPYYFNVLDASTVPTVTDVSPDNGPYGQYVTVTGFNFGPTPNRVLFVCVNPSTPGCNGQQYEADTVFPSQCSLSWWQPTQIIVKVPTDLLMPVNEQYYVIVETSSGQTSQPNSLVVGVNDFTVNNNPLTPGVCRISPTGGPIGTPVDYYGEGFGSATGAVYFESSTPPPVQSTPVFGWNDTTILDAGVPNFAIDGPTYVESASSQLSNEINFTVGTCTDSSQCSTGSVCCVNEGVCRLNTVGCSAALNYDENGWKFTSGQIPFGLLRQLQCTEGGFQSPTPFPYAHTNINYDLGVFPIPPMYSDTNLQTNAPTNVVIAARFTRAINYSTIPGNVKIYQCNSNSASFNPGACTNDITDITRFQQAGYDGFRYDPGNLQPYTWYEVRLDDGTANSLIRAQDGSYYKGNDFLGNVLGSAEPEDFRWHFRTRTASQAQCEISDVNISPGALNVPIGGTSGALIAQPINPQCYICSGNYNYEWECNDIAVNPPQQQLVTPNEYVRYSTQGASDYGADNTFCTTDDANQPTGNAVQFTGHNISPDKQTPTTGGPQPVVATITNAPGPSGTTQPIQSLNPAYLSVDYVRPRVIKYRPSNACALICTNSIVDALFNIPLQGTSIPSNVRVFSYAGYDANKNCTGSSAPVNIAINGAYGNSGLRVLPQSGSWNSNTCYRVILNEGISNVFNQTMDPAYLNYDEDGNGTNDAFSWDFVTSRQACTPDTIDLTPDPYTLYSVGGTVQYTASTEVTDPLCGLIPLDPNVYDWTWSSSSNAVAQISQNRSPSTLRLLPIQTATALAQGNTTIQASYPSGPPAGTAQLTVIDNRAPFDFIGYRPDAVAGTYSPPLSSIPGPGCLLSGGANQCQLACTNVLASAIFSFPIDPSSVIPRNINGVSYYGFENSVLDGIGSAHGVIQGSLTYTTPNTTIPSLGRALRFVNVDGNRVVMANSNAHFPGTGSWAIEAWINSTSGKNYNNIVNKWCPDCGSTGFGGGFVLTFDSAGTLRFTSSDPNQFSTASYSNLVTVLGNTPVNDGNWHHILGQVNQSTREAQLFIDGVLQGTQPLPPQHVSIDEPGQTFRVGDLYLGNNIDHYVGLVDEIQFYKTAFSPFEVTRKYNEYFNTDSPGKFYVQDLATNSRVPGRLEIRSYTDTTGFCVGATGTTCQNDAQCGSNGPCSLKRGRIDFIPEFGGSGTAPQSTTARYSFNFDSGGQAIDETGNGFNGNVFGATNISAGCADGNCYSFAPICTAGTNTGGPCMDDISCGAGGNCSQEYIMIDDDPALRSPSFSFSVWALFDPNYSSLTGDDNWGTIFNKAPLLGASGWSVYRQQYTNGEEMCFFAGNYTTNITCASFTPGTWYHWAGTFDSAAGEGRLYRNGFLVGTFTSGGIGSNPQPLTIGASNETTNPTNGRWNFAGQIDAAQYFNYALNPADILALSGTHLPAGVYNPNSQYEVRLCDNNSCDNDPIRSVQGVGYPTTLGYSDSWAFTSGDGICQISRVEISPNPYTFGNRYRQCLAGDPICTDMNPQTLFAQAKDVTGLDLSGATYSWRETTDQGGTVYNSLLYSLNQAIPGDRDAQVWHRGVIGTDYNQVTAGGVGLGSASELGRMNFYFCENPWIGDTTGTAYYLDPAFDFRLSYCRDYDRGILPNLPVPHIIRDSSSFTPDLDLLKEHVFIVGSDIGSDTPIDISGGAPYHVGPTTEPQAQVDALGPPFVLNNFVTFDVDAIDPDGDSFIHIMTSETGADRIPVSANFNQRTGVFSWTVDTIPTTDGDGDGYPDFELTFSLSPTGDTRTVFINVDPQTPTPTPARPTATMRQASYGSGPTIINSAEGKTVTVDYGTSVTFIADADFATGSAITSFVWNFQDNGPTSYLDTSYSDYSASHAFTQSGQHLVTFSVQNDLGVWSAPASMIVNVRQKVSLEDGSFMSKLASRLKSILVPTVKAQAFQSPQNLTATSINSNNSGDPDTQLTWQNPQVYDSIRVYRRLQNGTENLIVNLTPGTLTQYVHLDRPPGQILTYRVCGVISSIEACSQVQHTSRNVDYDVIVARVYKNLQLLSIEEWYNQFAPNPNQNGSQVKSTVIDGYNAVRDGTSLYIGMANCVSPTDCSDVDGVAGGDIYANVLLLSYNAGASAETVTIFSEIVDTLQINDQLQWTDQGVLQNVWTCSGDASVVCEENHDQDCVDANAGLCMSPSAELRRDHERIVGLHDIANSLYEYAAENRFCADGSNSIACNVDADCPRDGLGNQIACTGVFPNLAAGSYVGGLSTSQWPSWDQTLASRLGRSSLPKDPINRFGANFYRVSPPPDSCNEFPGHDINTCWNEQSQEFKCHDGSLVYMYQASGGVSFNLYGQVEASGWALNWSNIASANVNINAGSAICTNDSPIQAVCGNGVIEGSEQCDGGLTNYCDSRDGIFGNETYNSEIQVGCNPPGNPTTECQWPSSTALNNQCDAGGQCGNGTVEGAEVCDPGNPASIAGYSCTLGGGVSCNPQTCQLSCSVGRPYTGSCGDGLVTLPEVCDDGTGVNGTPGKCNQFCSGYASFCGDGIVTATDTINLGCTCDDVAPGSCPTGYFEVKGSACSSASCGVGVASHSYTCVAPVEECDGVSGLAGYRCPSGETLYCDNNCNRACTDSTGGSEVLDAQGNRTTIPIYEHYYNQNGDEDYDYSPVPYTSPGYTNLGVAFYGKLSDTTGIFRYTTTSPSIDGSFWKSTTASVGYDFIPTSNPDQSLFNAQATGAIPTQWLQPVFRFEKAGNDRDFYFSRNIAPRTDSTGAAYVLQSSGSPFFHAYLGPFREACGNGELEGTETCEPDLYSTPAPAASNISQQYLCGQPLTPNQCQTYGGFCGDGTGLCSDNATACFDDTDCPVGTECVGVDEPFEQCDEGSLICSGLTGIDCKIDADCPSGQTCGGICSVGGNSCQTDFDCTANASDECLGNGASCNNNAGNCSYCTNSCTAGFLARNFCGDGIVNCGINTPDDCTDSDPFTEVCDDGGNNGQPGACNETCSGITGSVCGNSIIEQACSTDTSLSCQTICAGGANAGNVCSFDNDCPGSTCSNHEITTAGPQLGNPCPSNGVCGGEVCDDGADNGKWTYLCEDPATSLTNNIPCTSNGDCTSGSYTQCGTANVFGYCSFTCLERTPSRCGDGIIQGLPNDHGVDEQCDSGILNGTPTNCNATCTGNTAAVCNDGIIGFGEDCEPPSAYREVIDCTESRCVGGSNNWQICIDDTDCPSGSCVGQPGVYTNLCDANCLDVVSECHAFGLKVWSDGADVAWINENLVVGDYGGGQCSLDPQQPSAGADYSTAISPLAGNVCAVPAVGTTGYVVGPTNSNMAFDVVIDDNGNFAQMFIVGDEENAGLLYWRIEKRNYSTGALCDGAGGCLDGSFGTGGIISSGGNSGQARAVATDGTYIYVAGFKGADGIIEKYRANNGLICSGTNCGTAFGSNGVVTVPGIELYDIALDTTNGFMYVVGDNSSDAVIQKYQMGSGAQCTAFNCGTDFTPALPSSLLNAYGVAAYGSYVYFVGGTDSNNAYIAKVRADSGALCSAANCGVQFGANGIYTDTNSSINYDIAVDPAYTCSLNPSRSCDILANVPCSTFSEGVCQDVDVDNGFMFVVGADTGAPAGSRVEKRELLDGGLYDGVAYSPLFATAGIHRDPALQAARTIVLDENYSNYTRVIGGQTGADGYTKRLSNVGTITDFVVSDPISSIIYGNDYDNLAAGNPTIVHVGTTDSLDWYIEKRNQTTYTLETGGFGDPAGSVLDEVPYLTRVQHGPFPTSTTDLRPWDGSQSTVASYEIPGDLNVVAIKSWPQPSGSTKGFQAVYTSPTLRDAFFTTAGPSSAWACTSDILPAIEDTWMNIRCPGLCATPGNNWPDSPSVSCTFDSDCGASQYCLSYCRPGIQTSSTITSPHPDYRWRTPQTNNGAQCSYATYPNYVGADGQWVWSNDCSAAADAVYCRLVFGTPSGTAYGPGEYCGDGTRNGPEACDNGSANGVCPTDGSPPPACSPSCTANDCTAPDPDPFGSSFPAGTQVYLMDGIKNIEDLQVGDKIISVDLENQQTVISEVEATNAYTAYELYYVNEELFVTGLHPVGVFSIDGSITFKKIEDISIGDQMVGYTLKPYRVRTIEKVVNSNGITVYNPSMTEPNNYFVSNGSFIPTLFHNKCSGYFLCGYCGCTLTPLPY